MTKMQEAIKIGNVTEKECRASLAYLTQPNVVEQFVSILKQIQGKEMRGGLRSLLGCVHLEPSRMSIGS